MSGKNLEVVGEPGESKEAAMTRTLLRPTVQAGISIDALSSENLPEMELGGLIAELSNQVQAASEGHLGRGEGMLVAQAHTLDAIFHATSLCRQYGAVSRAGRAVPETRPEGAEQVQNDLGSRFFDQGSPDLCRPGNQPAQPDIKPENEFMEHEHGVQLDIGPTCTPGQADSAMAFVGEVDRTEDRRG